MNGLRRAIKTADVEQRLAKLEQQSKLRDGTPDDLQPHAIKTTDLEQRVGKLEKLFWSGGRF